VVIVPIWVIVVGMLTESLDGTLLSTAVPLTTIPAAARWLVNDFTHPPEKAPLGAADAPASRDTGN
jgi:hypothetical protein